MSRNKSSEIGIMIPREILTSDLLSLIEKGIFLVICTLGDDNYECFASNRTLGDFFGVKPRRVSDHIAALRKKGFLVVTQKKNQVRLIRVAGKYARKMRAAEIKKPAHVT